MTTFLLVHGAFHGAWCWHRVASRLKASGHRVVAPDLAGHGIDVTPRHQVTMDLILDRLCEVLDGLEERVTLVGHSLGGVVISNLAERRPARINRLVYVTAFLLAAAENSVSALAGGADQLGPQASMSLDGTQIVPELAHIGEYLYNECDADDVTLATMLLVPENVAVASASVATTEERWGSIPRTFIECALDRGIPIELQIRMNHRIKCDSVFRIETDHSPFFSTPDRLSGILATL